MTRSTTSYLKTRIGRSIPIALAIPTLAYPAFAQVIEPLPTFTFTDVSADAGINLHTEIYDPFRYVMPFGMVGGVAAADFDGDGDIDLFVPNGSKGIDSHINAFDELPSSQEAADGRQRPDLLYINHANDQINPSPTFTEVDFATFIVDENGIPIVDFVKPKSHSALWLDYDGDRLLDLLIIGGCFRCDLVDNVINDGSFTEDDLYQSVVGTWFTPRLYRQRHDGSFFDVTASTRLDQVNLISDWFDTKEAHPLPSDNVNDRHMGAISSGDIDGDGYPEIFIGMWTNNLPNFPETRGGRLLLNTTGLNGRQFRETSGVLASTLPNGLDDGTELGSYWQSMFVDIDNDGDLDVLAAGDGDGGNPIWINNTTTVGNLMLSNQSVSLGMPSVGFDMGMSVGDYDNDGDFDFFITDLVFTDSLPPDLALHELLRNNITTGPSGLTGQFHSVQGEAGTVDSLGNGTWGWGTTFADVNSDGWLDILMTNGVPSEYNIGPCIDASHLFLNTSPAANPSDPAGAGRLFVDTLNEAFDNADFPDTLIGNTLIAFDFDRDADLDLFQTVNGSILLPVGDCPLQSDLRLYKNESVGTGPGASLIVRPRAAGANSHAIGAKITVVVGNGGLVMTRTITAGISLMGQEPAEAHFGLGDILSSTPIAIIVKWLDSSQPDSVIVTNGADIIANPIRRVGWCSYADLAAPYGILDDADMTEFLNLLAAQDPRADFAAPFGTYNTGDLSAFFGLLNAGCDLY